ncbi:MAG: 5-(carboxyamino)imidazole ribonucleotide mutase [Candidatus Dormibacteraeota bacterium]|nr:5-(carboxyamino)imidazole ribonucleotide mutase [Candidatus Dormibacteraeota bacterium]MBV9525116.1 5-(carboxyamino)imidazole ribonucleotide mutase [Candidatus Dormibacteraeota bacterium]
MSAELRVGIVVGSKSDLPVMRLCGEVLDGYGVGWEIGVMSAHRAGDVVRAYGLAAKARGLRVLVAGAGAAAHLPGVLASITPLPVIGVPLAATPLAGFDSLLSIAQMPPGIPVATVAVGEMGARNAGHLAAEILAVADPEVERAILAQRARMRESVELPAGFSA